MTLNKYNYKLDIEKRFINVFLNLFIKTERFINEIRD